MITVKEILEYNRKIVATLGEKASLYRLSDFKGGMTKAKLVIWLKSNKLPVPGTYFADGKKIDPGFWQKASANRNIDGIRQTPRIKWGVCTARSNIRSFPVSELISDTPNELYSDLFQETAILLNEPVAVLHTSADGRWYYIVKYNYRGWVLKTDIGLYKDYDTWCHMQEMDDFLIVTASRFQLSKDPELPEVSELELTMGMKLKLLELPGTIKQVRSRMSYQNYIVSIPIRTESGMAEEVEVLIPESANVCRGFLRFTRSNVIMQAYKTLGEVYGWGGMLNSRDCSSLVLDVYACFGFRFPRNTDGINRLPGEHNVDLRNMTAGEKEEILKTAKGGEILYFPGHIMIYLGNEGGAYYCISAVGSFIHEDSHTLHVEQVNSVVVNTLAAKRCNGNTWMEEIENVIGF